MLSPAPFADSRVLGTMQIVIDVPDVFLALIELLGCGDTTAICETARDS